MTTKQSRLFYEIATLPRIKCGVARNDKKEVMIKSPRGEGGVRGWMGRSEDR
jgi:hypothetical protein